MKLQHATRSFPIGGPALACINAEAATLAMMMNEAANKIQAGSVYWIEDYAIRRKSGLERWAGRFFASLFREMFGEALPQSQIGSTPRRACSKGAHELMSMDSYNCSCHKAVSNDNHNSTACPKKVGKKFRRIERLARLDMLSTKTRNFGAPCNRG